MKKIYKVAIALCTYNEKSNILKLLRSILVQKEEGFVLSRIIVIDDGSTDKTVELIRKIKDPRVQLRICEQRVGKSTHLNEIYQSITEEFLVQTDADVIFAHKNVVRDIVMPLIKDKKVGMCGGNPLPFPAKGFVEEAVNLTVGVYVELRNLWKNGDNVLSADGRILSYRKSLLKKIEIPTDMIANDAFTFFACLTEGYKYKYVQNAVVNFRSPQTIVDQIRQNTRFRAAPIRMKRYFKSKLVEREYAIDKSLLFKLYLVTFIKHPFHCVFIYILNTCTKVLALKREGILGAKWDMAISTKKVKYA